MTPSRRTALISVLTPVILVLGICVAWAIDNSRQAGRMARNVIVAGVPVGSLSKAEAHRKIADLADEFPTTPIAITAGNLTLRTSAGDLGFAIDVDKTLADGLAPDKTSFTPGNVVTWLTSLSDTRRLPVVLKYNTATLKAKLIALEGTNRTKPVEPSLTLGPGGVDYRPGVVGHEIDVADVVAKLPGSLQKVGEPITISVGRSETKPRFSDAPFLAVKKQAEDLFGTPVTITSVGKEAVLARADLTAILSVATTNGTPRLVANDAAAAKVVATLMPASGNPTGVRFAMGNGGLYPVAGQDAKICCGPEAAKELTAGLRSGKHSIALTPRTMTAAEGVKWAEGLGVKKVVGSFTTNHPCCAARVTNIHRISDLTRGALIAPGATFSVNDFVGRRTAEKGFVSAGVISDGEFTEDFGGGVSQFATTLFNASFFAGLEIPDYKAHSVYISRYPFGREATLAYPAVDLKITNNTPYGVVIWPTYTDDSITVSLYSSDYAVGQVVGTPSASQHSDKVPQGCGTVTTVRKVTIIPTGATSTERFHAYYTCDPPKHP